MSKFDYKKINEGHETINLDLGAGGKSPFDNHLSIDISSDPGVDIKEDIFVALSNIEDDRVSSIKSMHFFEHIDDIELLLSEIVRVCKNKARIEIVVPHFSNPYYYSDITHCKFFGLYTFCYLANTTVKFKRKVPHYARVEGLCLSGVRMEYSSHRPHYLRHGFKKLVEKIVNTSVYMQEFSEEFLSWIVPCYQVRYILNVDKSLGY